MIPFEFVDKSEYQHVTNNYGFIYLCTTCLRSIYIVVLLKDILPPLEKKKEQREYNEQLQMRRDYQNHKKCLLIINEHEKYSTQMCTYCNISPLTFRHINLKNY